MKIITDNEVYVQKGDIAFLNSTSLPIPASIYEKFFGREIVITDDCSRYDFVSFNAPEEIEYFKNFAWLIDYNDFKDLSEDAIITLCHDILGERNSIARRFNSMSPKERDQNSNMVLQCKVLDFKMDSLRNLFLFKQGHIIMILPDGVDLPTGFVREQGSKKLIKKEND